MKPQRAADRGRIVVTGDGQEAEATPRSEPPVAPRSSVPVPARPKLRPPPARTELPPTPAQPSPSHEGAAPAPVGAKSVGAPPTDGTDRPEWCSIVFARMPQGGEFQVLTVEEGGRRKFVARSDPFRMPLSCRILPLRRLPNVGAPRRAHDLLVKRLVASGWRQMRTRGRWHDTALLRTRPAPQDRIMVGWRREGTTARFHAETLDTFGNVRSVSQSQPFAINPRPGGLRPTDRARAAHAQLLRELSAQGWASAGEPSPEWYANVLERPRH